MEEVALSWTLEKGDRSRGHLTFQREKGMNKAGTLKPCTVGDGDGMGPTGCGEKWSGGHAPQGAGVHTDSSPRQLH